MSRDAAVSSLMLLVSKFCVAYGTSVGRLNSCGVLGCCFQQLDFVPFLVTFFHKAQVPARDVCVHALLCIDSCFHDSVCGVFHCKDLLSRLCAQSVSLQAFLERQLKDDFVHPLFLVLICVTPCMCHAIMVLITTRLYMRGVCAFTR